MFLCTQIFHHQIVEKWSNFLVLTFFFNLLNKQIDISNQKLCKRWTMCFLFFLSSARKFRVWLLYQWSKRSLTRMQNSSTKEKKGQFTLGEPRHSRRRASKAATGIICKSKWSNTCTDEVGIINAADLVPKNIAHLKKYLLPCELLWHLRCHWPWPVWTGESQVNK